MHIVLDTNELVRALMRPSNLATFIMAWQSARFSVVASQALLAEYEYVLAEPLIASAISHESLRAFHSYLIHNIECIETPHIAPICRDPDDDKVIAIAISAKVDYLITQDSDLLTTDILHILNQYGVSVTTIDKFIALLDRK